jgi:hypothetical protein
MTKFLSLKILIVSLSLFACTVKKEVSRTENIRKGPDSKPKITEERRRPAYNEALVKRLNLSKEDGYYNISNDPSFSENEAMIARKKIIEKDNTNQGKKEVSAGAPAQTPNPSSKAQSLDPQSSKNLNSTENNFKEAHYYNSSTYKEERKTSEITGEPRRNIPSRNQRMEEQAARPPRNEIIPPPRNLAKANPIGNFVISTSPIYYGLALEEAKQTLEKFGSVYVVKNPNDDNFSLKVSPASGLQGEGEAKDFMNVIITSSSFFDVYVERAK